MDSTKILEQVNTVPVEFWYACTMILTAILIWVIQRYFSSLQATIKDLQVSIQQLTKLVALHAKDIEDHELDIKELKALAKKRSR